MKPAIALMPFASMTWPLVRGGAPAVTDSILPPRTTIEPRSMTVPLPTTMWAFVIVRSCAASGAAAPSARPAASSAEVSLVHVCIPLKVWPHLIRAQRGRPTSAPRTRPGARSSQKRVGGPDRDVFAIHVDAAPCRPCTLRPLTEERPLFRTPRHQALRTVWLSDVHLGSRECRVNLLLDFLRHTRCDVLYLVGDIVDLENLRKSFYWPASHTEVLRLLLKKSQEGTRIVYIPGNHDHDLHALAGVKFGNIEIASHAIHTTRAGRRLLVTHGDQFDAVVRRPSLGVLARRLRMPAPARR